MIFIPVHYGLWENFPLWYHVVFFASLAVMTVLGARLDGRKVQDSQLVAVSLVRWASPPIAAIMASFGLLVRERAMILVVGATGQLGTAVVRRLVASGQPVRAFVRKGSRHEHLRAMGAELAFGDLREPDSVDAACRGARVVVATANAVVPEGPSSFEAVEGRGYAALISACERHAVEQFVFISVPVTPHDDAVPVFRYKRLTEQRLRQSRLSYTIFQSSLFMDDWYAFIGSRIPLRGAEAATLDRRYWFLKAFMKGVDGLIDKHGIALIAGSKRVRHAFIALDDVAEFMVRSIGRTEMYRTVTQIGGPEIADLGRRCLLLQPGAGQAGAGDILAVRAISSSACAAGAAVGGRLRHHGAQLAGGIRHALRRDRTWRRSSASG